MPNIQLNSFFRFSVPCTSDAKHMESELESFIESQCYVTVENWECEIIGCKAHITIMPFNGDCHLHCKQHFGDAFADYTEWLAPVVPAVNKLSTADMHRICQAQSIMLRNANTNTRLAYNTNGVYMHKKCNNGFPLKRFYGVTYAYGEAEINAYIQGYIDAISA